MENRTTLKRRGWSIVRKAQIIGASVGASISIGVIVFANSYEHLELFDIAAILLILIVFPFNLICHTFGANLQSFSGSGWRECFFAVLVVITNAFILLLVGTFVGWLVDKQKNKQIFNSKTGDGL
jgi:predicted cobalt transporter CbtA